MAKYRLALGVQQGHFALGGRSKLDIGHKSA
jgi:hypothetical protein